MTRKKNPIRYVDGYQWGHQKIYPTRAGAERQARAIYAAGYKGKNPNSKDNEEEGSLQYYLDAEKRDREHEKEKMRIPHTGVTPPPRKCAYCPKTFDSLRELYIHLKTEHPDKPLKVSYPETNPHRAGYRRRNIMMIAPITAARVTMEKLEKKKEKKPVGLRFNPLTKKEKDEIKGWANVQYGISQRYQDDPTRSAFWRGRAVGMGKVAKVYNPSMTEKVGNLLGGMGILAIPVVFGFIFWAQSRRKE